MDANVIIVVLGLVAIVTIVAFVVLNRRQD